MTVAKNIKLYLVKNNITQKWLSNKTGIGVEKLSLSLNDKRKLDSEEFAKIIVALHENIKQNFKRNKERFNEGRDYYLLKGEQLKEFLQVTNSHLQNQSKIRSMYLWTERGANRHSKILDTDMAWKQFDILEETYFKVKSMSAMQMLKKITLRK